MPTQKPPGHFDQGVAHHRVTTPIDTAFSTTTVAVVDPRAEPGVTGDLAPVLEAFPAPELKLERYPAQRSDSDRKPFAERLY